MLLDYFPGQKWQGQVDFIYPEMNPNNRTLRVRLQFANANAQLKPNMFARIILTPQMDKKRLQIPRAAVIYAGNMNRVVLALGNGQFKSVVVNLGLENKEAVEVLSGFYRKVKTQQGIKISGFLLKRAASHLDCVLCRGIFTMQKSSKIFLLLRFSLLLSIDNPVINDEKKEF